MSLNPGSRSQILFSTEAFTSQTHSKSSPHREFFQGEKERAGSQFNKCMCLDNSCLSGRISLLFCSVLCHILCVHMQVLCIKPSFLKVAAPSSAAPQSQEHTGTHCTCSYLHSTEMIQCSLEPGRLDGMCVLAWEKEKLINCKCVITHYLPKILHYFIKGNYILLAFNTAFSLLILNIFIIHRAAGFYPSNGRN